MATKAQTLISQAEAELRKTRLGFTQLKGKPSGHWATGLKLLEQARRECGPPPKPHIALGPVIAGHPSLMAQDLTHITDGFTALGSVWPAYDDFAKPGTNVLAPETLTITEWGSARFGESIHAHGASGILYWFGHIDRRKPVGSKIKKGVSFCKISAEHPTPHVHVALDGRPLLGHDFVHRTGYKHGAPKVGVQLKEHGY